MAIQFRQLFSRESSTYTYCLWDEKTKEAIVIDSVREEFERDAGLLKEWGVDLKWILETHVHADHITGASLLKDAFGASIALSEESKVAGADRLLKDEDFISIGAHEIKVIETPGHTNSCVCYLVDGKLFTGDTLLIRGCGRTDFQEGSARKLFESVRNKLFSLADSTKVYPGHDYKGRTASTIEEEKEHNPRLKLSNSLEDFEKIMSELKLAPPKKIDEAVPANLKLGAD